MNLFGLLCMMRITIGGRLYFLCGFFFRFEDGLGIGVEFLRVRGKERK